MTDLGTVQDTVRNNVQAPALQTPSQTVGPFYGYALPYERGPQLVPGHHPHAIRFHGTVTDGAGQPILDALLEVWQADETGTLVQKLGSCDRDGFTFTGFGRAPTSIAGEYTFTTVKPGSVAGRAPYVLVTVFARGVTHHLFTRAYFPEDSALHASDPVLTTVPADRRGTLISIAEPAIAGTPSYRFDIRLQGENETVFLDFDA
ncbi:protocatechuate 3,4-dioxygenase subunit alpha [Cryobacterium frigoriphilum]|uniref:Protocatechuate 3,4-dioxygenase subunit alpha n=1 Tax=Cryobacterium frigoriphilum TaxID=1259150 RepID=A0A4R9AAQ6_9MICO|nr:protocatechuate 3,4-dioxygenase subunit alpha [Cryobacterium frigoriphilum]TFD54459.1 protocatechuate 3,4-dioxygenase subunit alpha [Cryobacterium frigoriphilum]